MAGRKLFGTDGVRERANVEPMTAEMALALGQTVSQIFRRRGGDRHRIIIGKDTRLSGYMFEYELVAGICHVSFNRTAVQGTLANHFKVFTALAYVYGHRDYLGTGSFTDPADCYRGIQSPGIGENDAFSHGSSLS